MHSTLKPCPFCGGSARMGDRGIAHHSFKVFCTNPSCTAGQAFATQKEAAEDWNRRADREGRVREAVVAYIDMLNALYPGFDRQVLDSVNRAMQDRYGSPHAQVSLAVSLASERQQFVEARAGGLAAVRDQLAERRKRPPAPEEETRVCPECSAAAEVYPGSDGREALCLNGHMFVIETGEVYFLDHPTWGHWTPDEGANNE